MTLREQFKQWFINDEEEHYIGTVETVATEHEKVAEEFAIGFAEWVFKNKGNMELYKITPIDNSYMLKSTKELLQIYKKEKGL